MADPKWHAHLAASAKAFRLGEEASGNDLLTALIDAIMPLVSGLGPEHLQRLNSLLAETLSAQARQDYLWVADLLEHEILPCLMHARQKQH